MRKSIWWQHTEVTAGKGKVVSQFPLSSFLTFQPSPCAKWAKVLCRSASVCMCMCLQRCT